MGLIARLFGQFAQRSARVPGVVPSAPLIEAQHHEYFAKGQEAFLRGDLDEARVWFGKLEAENTRLGIAWVFLGNLAKGDVSLPDHQTRALKCYARARSLHFDSIEVAINIAATYLDQEQARWALRELEHVRAQGVQVALWHFHFGRALEMEFDFVQAHAAYATAFQLDPSLIQARLAHALVLAWIGRFSACLDALQELERHGLTQLEVARQIVLIGSVIGYPSVVEERARFVLEHDADDKGAQLGLANVLLAKARFADGWRWFEARVDNPIYPIYRPVLPLWRGESLAGRHLWVYEEQGFGDEILFARFLPMLARQTGRLTVQCKPGLHRLMRSIPGIEWVSHKGRMTAAEMTGDFELPLMSLPARLGVVEPTLLSTLPPFAVPADLMAHWQRAVAAAVAARVTRVTYGAGSARKPRVGFGINGASHRKDNALRSVPPACAEGLTALACDFFWIQPAADHANSAALDARVIDLTAGLKDFLDTAALLMQLDIVICVDTAVAHLAATLGLETWVLLPRMRDWRWEIDGHGCLWYPRVRTFRVTEQLDWQGLMDQVTLALETRIHQGFPAITS